jgi:hypothetical protein
LIKISAKETSFGAFLYGSIWKGQSHRIQHPVRRLLHHLLNLFSVVDSVGEMYNYIKCVGLSRPILLIAICSRLALSYLQ